MDLLSLLLVFTSTAYIQRWFTQPLIVGWNAIKPVSIPGKCASKYIRPISVTYSSFPGSVTAILSADIQNSIMVNTIPEPDNIVPATDGIVPGVVPLFAEAVRIIPDIDPVVPDAVRLNSDVVHVIPEEVRIISDIVPVVPDVVHLISEVAPTIPGVKRIVSGVVPMLSPIVRVLSVVCRWVSPHVRVLPGLQHCPFFKDLKISIITI